LDSKPYFALRPATADDQTPINAFIRTMPLNPWGLKWQNFIVAEDKDGEFIGCGQIKHHRSGVDELASIAVVPEWRGRGVAGAIITHLQDRHQTPLWLVCHSRLISFYEQFGFSEQTEVSKLPSPFKLFKRITRLMLFLSRKPGHLAVMYDEQASLT
jgi:amino-acid N-acetyltransferase